MASNSNTIGPLKKVSLVFTAGTTSELKDLLAVPEPLEFIFSIGTQGLTQFECVLDGKKTGDQGTIEINKDEMNEIFGHIIPCTYLFPLNAAQFFMHYNIIDVTDASPQEIIKSMAAAGGGCGDGCSCGCGSH
jgi:hypothetical protein